MQALDARQTDWSEEDKIYLALQLFQQRERRYGSRLSAAQILFEHLLNYQPDWDDVPLPLGRTVAQGRAVFGAYSRQSSGPSTSQSAGPSPASFGISLAGGSTGGVPSRKRSAPSSDALTQLIGRPLAPKQPATFGTETASRQSITGHQTLSPMVDPSPRPHEPRKKRGRPTKQEAEERRRQMEERQQRRMQAQGLQTTLPSQAGQAVVAFAPQFRPLAQSGSTSSDPQILQDESNSGSIVSPLFAGVSQTPRKPPTDEQNSSGSSGKKRRLRPPRLSGSDAEPPSLPLFRSVTMGRDSSTSYSSPLQPNLQNEGREFQHDQVSSGAAGQASAEIDMSRFDADEDNRALNPRSRPWEVMERSGP